MYVLRLVTELINVVLFFPHIQIEKFHKLWNFENCQFSVMEKKANGSYKLVSELKSDE